MKKIILIIVLAFIGTFSYGQTYKTIKITKNGKTDTLLVKTVTTVDTIPRPNTKSELEKIKTAKKANGESRKIQNAEFDRLDKYYDEQILILTNEKKKTD